MSVSAYKAIEADIDAESKGGSVSPLRVCREMAANARMHDANKLASLFDAGPNATNRENHRANQYRNALRALLFALHARPLFGGPHLSLEDAIANANAVLDKSEPRAEA